MAETFGIISTASRGSLRYLGRQGQTDDIYHANKAKIPDKAHLLVGIQLVIPGVSATGK